MAASTALMGARGRFATSRALTAFCAFVAAAVCGINGWFLVQFRQEHLPPGAGPTVGWAFVIAAYYSLIAYFAAGPDRLAKRWRARRPSRALAATGGGGGAGAGASSVRRLAAWARQGVRRWDPESMLEV